MVDIKEAQSKLKSLLTLAREGDEIVIEENGQEIGKITPSKKLPRSKRVAGLGRGTISISDDFNDELPDEFWGIDKEI